MAPVPWLLPNFTRLLPAALGYGLILMDLDSETSTSDTKATDTSNIPAARVG